MPIKFRCKHCRQFLGISRARAGEITDCPMCGKAIRVPNLDGTVDPIPSPELDLGDSELVAALGELAEIGTKTDAAAATTPPKIVATHEATVIMPAAEAVPKPPPVPAEPVPPSQSGDDETIIQADHDGGTVIDRHDDPVHVLAQAGPSPVAPQTVSPGGSHWPIWIAAIGGTAVVVLAALFWMNTGRDASPQKVEAAAVDPAVPAPSEVSHPAEQPTINDNRLTDGELQGHVTYVSSGGETLPDEGATVLLLPLVKAGTVRLDVTGFLAGAEPVDIDVARAAMQALGGDVATVDETGQYHLSVERAGDYHLLVISRHFDRVTTSTVSTQLQEVLTSYFFRPASLLGTLAFQFEKHHADGERTVDRDFRFADE